MVVLTYLAQLRIVPPQQQHVPLPEIVSALCQVHSFYPAGAMGSISCGRMPEVGVGLATTETTRKSSGKVLNKKRLGRADFPLPAAGNYSRPAPLQMDSSCKRQINSP